MSKAFTMQAEGYDELAAILLDAFKQASEGKGAERHANDLPFDSQPMQTISDIFDSDKGMAFQVVKKLREGLDMPEYDRLERELLGSIVYTAGIILWHKQRHSAKKEPKPTFTIQTTDGGAHHRVAELAQEIKDHLAEDEPVWRHWRAGDIVTCIEGEGWNEFVTGGLYPVTATGDDYVEIAGTQVRRFLGDFAFHSRPSK